MNLLDEIYPHIKEYLQTRYGKHHLEIFYTHELRTGKIIFIPTMVKFISPTEEFDGKIELLEGSSYRVVEIEKSQISVYPFGSLTIYAGFSQELGVIVLLLPKEKSVVGS